MKGHFIELTETDGTKLFMNTIHIAWFEPHKGGSSITFNLVNYSFSKKVKETYDEIKAMMNTTS
jgi:hypothetical protein